jgi:hypothetical protein
MDRFRDPRPIAKRHQQPLRFRRDSVCSIGAKSNLPLAALLASGALVDQPALPQVRRRVEIIRIVNRFRCD